MSEKDTGPQLRLVDGGAATAVAPSTDLDLGADALSAASAPNSIATPLRQARAAWEAEVAGPEVGEQVLETFVLNATRQAAVSRMLASPVVREEMLPLSAWNSPAFAELRSVAIERHTSEMDTLSERTGVMYKIGAATEAMRKAA